MEADLKLREIDVDEYLRECVVLDDLSIDEEMSRLPGDLAFWGEMHSRALRAHLLAQLAVKQARAAARLFLVAQNEKARVDDVNAAVEAQPSVQEAEVQAIEAEVEKVRLRTVLDAIGRKADMLQSIGARLRAEMTTSPLTAGAVGVARGSRG